MIFVLRWYFDDISNQPLFAFAQPTILRVSSSITISGHVIHLFVIVTLPLASDFRSFPKNPG